MEKENIKIVYQNPKDLNGDLVWLMLSKTSYMREQVIERFQYTYMQELSRSDMKFVSSIIREASTVSEVAKSRGISRQAAHKGLQRLEKLGYIKLENKDNKSLEINLTPKGQALVEDTRRVLAEIERNIAMEFGNEALDFMHKILSTQWAKDEEKKTRYMLFE